MEPKKPLLSMRDTMELEGELDESDFQQVTVSEKQLLSCSPLGFVDKQLASTNEATEPGFSLPTKIKTVLSKESIQMIESNIKQLYTQVSETSNSPRYIKCWNTIFYLNVIVMAVCFFIGIRFLIDNNFKKGDLSTTVTIILFAMVFVCLFFVFTIAAALKRYKQAWALDNFTVLDKKLQEINGILSDVNGVNSFSVSVVGGGVSFDKSGVFECNATVELCYNLVLMNKYDKIRLDVSDEV